MGEVKRWGQKELDIQGQQWSFSTSIGNSKQYRFVKRYSNNFLLEKTNSKNIQSHQRKSKKKSFTLLEAEPELQEDVMNSRNESNKNTKKYVQGQTNPRLLDVWGR